MGTGIGLVVLGVALSLYSIPPVSPLAFLALILGIALVMAGGTLVRLSRQGP